MIVWNFFIFAIIGIAVAEIPSFMKVCGRRNPNLDQCIMNNVNALRKELITGIPSLQIPSLEPLSVDKEVPLTRLNSFMLFAKNLKLYNIHSYKLENIHLDFDKKEFDVDVSFDVLRLTGDVNITTRILVPVTVFGPMDAQIKNVNAKAAMKYQLINTKKGTRVFFSEMTCKLIVGDFKANFSAVGTSDKTFTDGINNLANTHSKEILEGITPQLEKIISEIVLELSNKIFKQFTYEELFPDRE